MSDNRIRYTGDYFNYHHSSNGKAVFTVTLSRRNRNNKREFQYIEIEIERSDINCIRYGLKRFADKEREEVGNLSL